MPDLINEDSHHTAILKARPVGHICTASASSEWDLLFLSRRRVTITITTDKWDKRQANFDLGLRETVQDQTKQSSLFKILPRRWMTRSSSCLIYIMWGRAQGSFPTQICRLSVCSRSVWKVGSLITPSKVKFLDSINPAHLLSYWAKWSSLLTLLHWWKDYYNEQRGFWALESASTCMQAKV